MTQNSYITPTRDVSSLNCSALGRRDLNRTHAKKYANKVGMMHESKGQHIGKAPSLHLFHTAFRQCMGVFLKHTIRRLGMRLKPCHVFLQHYHKSVLTVAPLLHASGTT